MKKFKNILPLAFILAASLVSKTGMAGSLNLPAGAQSARVCAVTQNEDNAGIMGSLRRALDQGYNIQSSGVPAFCSEKINFEVGGTFFLNAPIVLNRSTSSGFTLEKAPSVSGEVTLDASRLPAGSCAITINAARVTLRNLKIQGARGGTGICLEGGARQALLDNVTVTDSGNGVWVKDGAQGNTIQNGAFHDNSGIGVRLDSGLQNRVSLNALYRNAQAPLSSPNESIKPNLANGAAINSSATTFSLSGLVPSPVERIEIFRSVPSQTPSNWIKTLLAADLQGLSFVTELSAQNGENIFAIAISTDGSTSALSNILQLDSTRGNNSTGPRLCFPEQIFPPNVDFDHDDLPDYLEDKNKNCRVDNDETDPTRADTDQDLIPDGIEDFNRNGQQDEGESSPRLLDTDGDGISDGIEDKNRNGRFEFGELNPNSPDTDSDGLLDWQEDTNRDGEFNEGETKAFLADTDLDGLADGAEDANRNGIVDILETDPRVGDTDGDGLLDGSDACPRVSNRVCQRPCVVGETPPEDLDTDQDNIPDSIEDFNHNCSLDVNETDPYLMDTDVDGQVDSNDPCPRSTEATCTSACVAGAPVPANRDSDSDGTPNVREDVNGNCIVDPGESNPFDSDSDNDGSPDGTDACPLDSNPLCSHTCVVGQVPAQSVDSDGDGIADLYEDLNHNCTRDGSESDFRQRDTDHDGLLDNQDACPNSADANCTCVPGQFVPPTRDSDRDGIPDVIEDANNNCLRDITETSSSLTDTDEDGIPDGNEDRNHDGVVDAGETNPLLADSDADGINDGLEDRNHNGVVDFGETNPSSTDSDQDGIPDRIEDENHNGSTDRGETSASLPDTDQDGLNDGAEDKNHNGRVDAGETDPRNADTDGDGATDGQEVSQGTNPIISRNSDYKQATGQGSCALQFASNLPGSSSLLFWTLSSLGILAFMRKRAI